MTKIDKEIFLRCAEFAQEIEEYKIRDAIIELYKASKKNKYSFDELLEIFK